jgi:hypothetical protein
VATVTAGILMAGVPIVIPARRPHVERGWTSPQRVITGVQVSSHLASLLIPGCSFVVVLNFLGHLVQRFLGRGEQSGGDCGALRSTVGAEERVGALRETPSDPRARCG